MDRNDKKFTLNRNALLIVALVAMVALVSVLEAKRRLVASQLEQVTIRLEQLQTGSTKENREKAQRVIQKVRKLIEIGDIDPTVATIVDVEALQKRNPFYNKAKDGDFLVVTSERAILYDEVRDLILDVVPVQVQPIDKAAVPPPPPEGEVPPAEGE